MPWGISESGFNARDLAQTYQYSSFGVPGLGLKRGLSEDFVVAPYATALAAMIEPKAAVRNFARFATAGGAGRYGFREALDYTARRLPEGASVAVVNSYMAHHQGMALVAIGNVLNDRVMVERFHADPIVEATELLLQERMPRDVLVARPRAEEVKSVADVRDLVPPILRRFTSPHDAIPRTHLLVERPVRGDGDGGGVRVQPLGRRGGDPLARGRDPRLVGQLPVPARHADRRGVVGRPPTQRRRGRPLRGHLLGGSRRVLASRRLDRDGLDRSSCRPSTTPRSAGCR